MSPALLAPLALAALGALLIPLLIHIARRTESRTVDFAALRWLARRARPRSRPRLDERRLLAVRLLLLALVALWLAQPVLWGVDDDRPVIAVAPGSDADTVLSDPRPNARAVWLAPGFPSVAEAAPSGRGNLVSLVRQLDAETSAAAPLEIVVPAVLDGVDAERPRLSRRVTWRALASEGDDPAAEPTASPSLTVRYAPSDAEGVRYFRAAAIAWTSPGETPAFEAAPTDRPLDRDARRLVWLAAGPVPRPVIDWIRDGGTALLSRDARLETTGEARVVWSDAVGRPLALATTLGRGRVIRLTQPLAPASTPQLVEPDFPDVLSNLIDPRPAPARVDGADHAPLTGAAAYPRPPFDLRPWLALLIVLVLACERWLATGRARAVAP